MIEAIANVPTKTNEYDLTLKDSPSMLVFRCNGIQQKNTIGSNHCTRYNARSLAQRIGYMGTRVQTCTYTQVC
jgi:hypothetical protein